MWYKYFNGVHDGNLILILCNSSNTSIILDSESNTTVHILDACESGMKQTQPVTPTDSKRGKCKRITEVRSETQLTVSRLGKAAIKGRYINVPVIQHLTLLSLSLCRARAVPTPFRCHAVPLIHTCHATPLPCSDSAVSFMKVCVVAGNIQTASPTV